MNVFQATKLMLKPDLWESSGGLFTDELRTKDGRVRFYSEQAVRFREGYGNAVVYEIPFIAWLWIAPLAQLLRARVNRNSQLRDK